MLKDKGSIAIFWHRRDLRLHDNRGLFRALRKHGRVLPIFIFDRRILDDLEDRADKRVDFIHRALGEMQSALTEQGSSLWTHHGAPLEAFQKLLGQFEIEAVYTNRDYEPYAIARDREIHDFLNERGIPFHTFKDQVVFETDEVLTDAGAPYTVFTPFKRKWLDRLHEEDLASLHVASQASSFVKVEKPFPLIPLEDMGFESSGATFPSKSVDDKLLARYHERRDIPALDATSHLSVHLRFGTVSVRETSRRAREINQTWLSELIWREFFMQILYHYPHVVDRAFRSKYDAVPWRDDREDFARWREGRTGFPIVDAGMRELNETGYMHNRVRMITASFLCKHLLLDWRWGERYFAAKLLDYDLAANNGNWQWAAGTGCDAAPYFRVFNPWRQAEKFDPDRKYIKKWVPECDTVDYPRPMVDHSTARKRALATYKAALEDAPETSRPEPRQLDLFD